MVASREGHSFSNNSQHCFQVSFDALFMWERLVDFEISDLGQILKDV